MLRLPAKETCNANKYGDPHIKGRRSMRAGHDPLTDEGGIDLLDEAVEAHGRSLSHLACGLEQEQIVEIEGELGDQSVPQSVPFISQSLPSHIS